MTRLHDDQAKLALIRDVGFARHFRASRWRITAGEQHVLWWGGLRGALALALALSLPDSLPLRDTIVVATFGVVAFSIIVQGLTMPLLLRALGFMPQDGA